MGKGQRAGGSIGFVGWGRGGGVGGFGSGDGAGLRFQSARSRHSDPARLVGRLGAAGGGADGGTGAVAGGGGGSGKGYNGMETLRVSVWRYPMVVSSDLWPMAC